MNHFTNLSRILFGTSLLALCSWFTSCQNVPAEAFVQTISFPDKLQEKTKVAPVTISKFLPFEILNDKATSYADITLKIQSDRDTKTKITLTEIEIITENNDKILLNSELATIEESSFPAKVWLEPGETITLNYRLQSPKRIYSQETKVYAKVYYQQDEQLLQRVIVSPPENVAFTIP